MKKKIFFLFLLGGIYFFVAFQINFRCYASDENDLVISEIMFDPKGSNSSSSEWIEFYNAGENEIVLQKETFKFSDKESPEFSSASQRFLGCHSISENITIPANGFFILAENKNNFKKQKEYETIDPAIVFDSSFDLSSSHGFLKLSNDNCASFFLEINYESSWGGKNNDKTLEKKDLQKNSYSENDWQESFCVKGTPGKKNSQKNDCSNENNSLEPKTPENSSYTEKVKINEIYPAPNTKNGEEEFIEIVNQSEKPIDFSTWTIKDSKGAKGKISKKEEIGNFIVFYGSFSLNNDSNGDTVFLYDENNNLIASQKYANGKLAYSYSFSGSAWRWTSLSTPGAENSFDKILFGKITLSKKIYRNTYVYFDVAVGKDVKKFVWDFGDGHKSYLKKTKHKYEKDGKYSASLKITGDGEDRIYNFSVKVEKYKAPKIRIVSFSPNPKGSDTKNEWIEIKNESQKKINLKGWSIATGEKKMINHPIRKNFEIKAGKTKRLLRNICAFTLVNTKDKIELRDPSGKIAQKIKYDHGKKSISEDKIYSKIDKEWKWVETQNDTKNEIEHPLPSLKETNQKTNEENATITKEFILNIPDSEIQTSIGKYTLSPPWQKKKDIQQKLVLLNSKLQNPQTILANQPKVLGTQKISLVENYYFFINPSKQKHWAIELLENSWNKINFSLNYFRLKIAI